MSQQLPMARLLLILSVILVAPRAAPAQGHPGLTTIQAGSRLDTDNFRQWNSLVDRMIRSRELMLRAAYDDRLLPDRRHERYAQYHQGVPVYGGDVSIQTLRGATVSVIGAVYTGIDVDPVPVLSAADAEARASDAANAAVRRAPTLMVVPTLDGKYALAYLVTTDDFTTRFIDAHSGALLQTASEKRTQSAIGQGHGGLGDLKKVSATRTAAGFQAKDNLRPTEVLTLRARTNADVRRVMLGTRVESDIALDSDNVWDDEGVVDGHAHMGWVYDYFFKRHNWRGLDGRDGRVTSMVIDRAVVAERNNAFFLQPPFGPDGRGLIGFGETSGGFAVATVDAAAHEAMHAVTYFAVSRRTGEGLGSFLIFDGLGPASVVSGGRTIPCDRAVIDIGDRVVPFFCIDGRFAVASSHSGALNEGFADALGTAAEFFFQEPGNGLLKAEYLIGEDITAIGPFRSLENPRALHVDGTRTVRYPDHFSRRLRFAIVIVGNRLEIIPLVFLDGNFFFLQGTDSGAVHWNATVLGHAFYLAVEGGRNRTSRRSVQGVGTENRDQIERIFFRAMTDLMPSGATFPVAASALRQSAVDLFGVGSSAFRAIDKALTAVGL